jgi:hypoxanthine phosphoribosyltransferase
MSLDSLDKIFISADSLLRDSIELGLRVVRSGFKPTFLVGIWRGGAPIGIAVQEILEYNGIECDHVSIRTSSYTGIDQQSRTVRVHAVDYLVSALNAEDQLLLIDDVFDSGRSLEAIIAELRRRCRRNLPERIRIATAYYKPARNRSNLIPDYFVRATDQWLVFPHEVNGLTREEILANKPVDESFFTARMVGTM